MALAGTLVRALMRLRYAGRRLSRDMLNSTRAVVAWDTRVLAISAMMPLVRVITGRNQAPTISALRV